MPQDGDTLRSDAEGEAAVLRGIVANSSQHTWMHHATTKHLYPTGVFTGATTRTGGRICSMTRICIGEVCVRSKIWPGTTQKVSCISRAGWSVGIFRAWKL